MNQPNRVQKGWREDVGSLGSVLSWGDGQVEIHHVVGRTAVHNKVHIGHWFILPVTEGAHRIVEKESKDDQKKLFRNVCTDYFLRYGELPFGSDVLLAIWDYRR